eukprot:10254-Heterococcus_DN1.PRE.2
MPLTNSHNREQTRTLDSHNREQPPRFDPYTLPVLDPSSISTKNFASWSKELENLARLPAQYGGLGRHINTILVSTDTPTFEDYSDINGHLHALLAISCKGHAHVIVDRYRSSQDGR